MLLLSEESKVFKSLNVFGIFVGLQNGIHLINFIYFVIVYLIFLYTFWHK